jgi:hypothetical protein
MPAKSLRTIVGNSYKSFLHSSILAIALESPIDSQSELFSAPNCSQDDPPTSPKSLPSRRASHIAAERLPTWRYF